MIQGDVAQVLKHVAHLTTGHQNTVVTSLDYIETQSPEDQPVGVVLPCWGCKVLRKPVCTSFGGLSSDYFGADLKAVCARKAVPVMPCHSK